MNEKVVIIGAGGHGKVIADIILKSGDSIVGFLDDNLNSENEFIGFPILGTVLDAQKWKWYKYIIAIGNADIREQIAKGLEVNWYTAIHPTAVISKIGVEIDEGTVIMANAVLNSDAKIGKHCIINTGAIIEHDDVIEDFAHISVGAKLAGNVSVGKKTWIGMGSQVIQGKSVCAETMVGAGAVVVENIKRKGTYMGVPAKENSMKRKMCLKNLPGGGRIDLRIRQCLYGKIQKSFCVCIGRGAA